MKYSEFVRSRFKSGEKIAEEMTPHKAALLNMISGQVVDSANSLDLVKKYAIYNKQNTASQMPVSLDEQRLYKDFKPTPEQCELLHAADGLAGEAGELLDAVRKHVFDGHDLDVGNCVEEMGDLFFYFEAMRQCFDWVTIDVLIATNMEKLSERFKDGYTDQAAIERADKAGEE